MKTNIGVIFGGDSNEYTISLRTCAGIIENIDKERYNPIAIGITRAGRWYMTRATAQEILEDRWLEGAVEAIISPDPSHKGLLILEYGGYRRVELDCIFPAVHGQNCEDGVLQGLLELSGIPYVGCGVAASASCFDKELTHILCEASDVPMAKSHCIHKWDYTSPEATEVLLEQKLGYPMFIKPCCSGSSVGVAKVKSRETLHKALIEAFDHDDKVLAEEAIIGREVECAVLGNLDPIAPVVGEVESVDAFYDFDSKYVNSTAKISIPAHIPEETSLEIREMAKKIFLLLGCRGLARVDFFVTRDNRVVFNEINTLPGFTSISMYPKMMIHSGMSYTQLISRLIKLAVDNKRGEA